MAATDAIAFPVYGQAFRLYWRIVAYSTANPITSSLTSLAATVSKDGGSFASTTNSPTAIGTSGYGYVDLTASEMEASSLIVQVSASNSGAVYFAREIVPLRLAAYEGRYDDQTVKRLEQILVDIHAPLYNEGVNTSTSQTYGNPDGATKVSGNIVQTTDPYGTATRGKME